MQNYQQIQTSYKQKYREQMKRRIDIVAPGKTQVCSTNKERRESERERDAHTHTNRERDTKRERERER
jgi:hypothetical protein